MAGAVTWVAALMLAAAWLRPPPPPADPLAALEPARIVAVRALSDQRSLPSAQVLAALRHTERGNGATVNWAGARLLRVTLAGGTALSLQAVPTSDGAFVRVTADAPPQNAAEAQAFRRLRNRALHVRGENARALLGAG